MDGKQNEKHDPRRHYHNLRDYGVCSEASELQLYSRSRVISRGRERRRERKVRTTAIGHRVGERQLALLTTGYVPRAHYPQGHSALRLFR
ncbi:unnamed protein product [Brugia pahangi]|uniref:Uncharacterized protein n=1 Tax=Brugia pahangi TaxID=6280 RepID=A0A0N4TSS8_BRUPA|nr:unnamed protein product [Brugia pahangi]